MDPLLYEAATHDECYGRWCVTAVDDDGRCFFSMFLGPEAEERAKEYASIKNAQSQYILECATAEQPAPKVRVAKSNQS